ncbi:CRISPR-associated endonuclease Cas1 [Methanobrevibacter thaueri]|uniref:CRISPR-associated endonuclease Cas1 n=1 Tax=Methanobrevibacter thaueri TaxID=190975 RepID=A0A315XQS3_9EURY|nr:CRISPR-associated endonuclease Cas1 [Methanobrevibacter thaueri]PWB88304.1 CRISPR-associated endonuclease Cas1 [Methanobrevibacter thaueri]
MKLVIDGYAKSIHKKDNRIVIHEKNQIVDSIRASEINDITIIGKGYLTFDALNLMAENNIKLIAINPRGQLTYTLESPDWRNVKLKKEQYRLSENRLGLEISKELIMSKMKNQKATLTTLNKNRHLKSVYNNRQKIEEIIIQLNQLPLNGDNETVRMKIMGLEGKASNEYWKGVKYFVPKEINFKSRTKKPSDLLNSMLNYGYAILASEITKSLLVNGLDPYCGLLHFDMDNRTSLTFDLIEPFRQQIVDKTVISLVNRKQVTIDDMDKRNNTIKLEARKLIVEKILSKVYSTITYGDETVSYSDLIVKQSENLVNSLLYGEKFKGFYLRW